MCLYPQKVWVGKKGQPKELLSVPCGKCIECCQRYSREWAFRCMDELKAADGVGCVITLTYNNESLPPDGFLCRRDVQLFLKSLRKHIEPQKVRFFGCGEYGGKKGRPHYHLCLFGWKPDDLQYLKKSNKGTRLYRSQTVDKLWKRGFADVAEMTYESALYSAKYMQKLRITENEEEVPPFTMMSLRPGIGAAGAVLKRLSTDSIFYNGKRSRLPRYYLTLLERNGSAADVENVKQWRRWHADLHGDDTLESLKIKREKYNKLFGFNIDGLTRKILKNRKKKK